MRKALTASLALCAAALFGCSGGNTTVQSGTSGTTGSTSSGTTAGGGSSTSVGIGSTAGSIGSTGLPTTAGITTGTSGTAGTSGSTGTSSSSSSSTSSSSTSTSGGATTGAGPWPMAGLTNYQPGEEIVDVSVDEAENIWAVSHDALYLLQPGQTQFKKFTDADGLHIANAANPGIMNVAGGHAGEAFVGYNGADWNGPGSPQITGDPSQDAVLREGGIDHIQLNSNGTITVVHPDVHSNDYWVNYPDGGSDSDASFMEDRGTRRMLYDHQFHDGTLYIGWNHGVDRFDWGKTDPTTGAMFADHVHPIVDSQGPNGTTEWMGEWRGLAVDPTKNGMLWMGGQYTGGALNWTPGLHDWTCQSSNTTWCPNGPNNFVHAWSQAWGGSLFPVAKDGDSMNIRAVTVAPDGTTYFASGPQWNPGTDPVYGVAVFKNDSLSYLDPVSQMHLPSNQLMDMVAMPDGTLMVAVMNGGLWRYNPATGTTTQVQGVSPNINMLYLDKLVNPVALYVASDQGISVIRDTNP